jgi:hypothetical protein
VALQQDIRLSVMVLRTVLLLLVQRVLLYTQCSSAGVPSVCVANDRFRHNAEVMLGGEEHTVVNIRVAQGMPGDSTDSCPAKSCSDHASHSRTLFLLSTWAGAGVVLSRMLAVSLRIRNSGHLMAIPLLEVRCASRRYIPELPLRPTSRLLEIVPPLGVAVPLGNPAGRELRTGLLRLAVSR